jgi:Rrf2 family protein
MFDVYICDQASRMFSKACEYGIRAMLYIARRSKEGTRVGIREISKAIDSPEPFMAKILQDLSRKGLVLSIKGPNGGFYMHMSHLQISLADIVSAIDGDQLFTGCGLGLKACNEKKPCPIHYQFKGLREDLKKMLQATAVGEFTESLEKGMFHLRRA